MRVRSGLDVLLERGPSAGELPGAARIGLVAHAASVDGEARHVARRIVEAGCWRLACIFAPEHGLWASAQDMERVGSTIDPASGARVVSLYGDDARSLRPRPEDLDGLDAIVFDLQDVGSRYYTFISTLLYVMEAAAGRGIPVLVLDRPNPIGGLRIEGPVSSPDLTSFVGCHPLPVRHGMTVGELARMFGEALGPECVVRVAPMIGWERGMEFEATGLPWVPPSPNMPSPATARVYPGGCLVEGTNLSEGRGTTTPFELVGAPWIDASALVGALRREMLPGVIYREASFRPMFQKHAGATCHGVQIIVRDAQVFRPFATYLAILREARELDPQRFAWRREPYEFEASRPAIDLLLGRTDLRPALERGATLVEMEALWRDDLARFDAARRRFLLYE